MDVLGADGRCGKETALKCSLRFLIRFVAASSISLCAWDAISSVYLRTVVPVVNWLLTHQQVPLHLEQRRDLLLYVYEPAIGGLRLQALDYDSVYLNLIAVAALFTATSGVNLGWRLRWIAGTWAFLWATHVLSFLIGGQVAMTGYLASLPPTEANAAVVAQLSAQFAGVDSVWVRVLELWNVWARYGLGVAVWYVAIRNRSRAVLGTPAAATSPGDGHRPRQVGRRRIRLALPGWARPLSEPTR